MYRFVKVLLTILMMICLSCCSNEKTVDLNSSDGQEQCCMHTNPL